MGRTLIGAVAVFGVCLLVFALSTHFVLSLAALAMLGVALLIGKTRLGLFVRGVTQNRRMAACVGVNTARVDTYAFALGAGIAGLAGCALSQVGNVGPDLGQGYIVDSFMVVVLGGVDQLAGAVWAALGDPAVYVEPFAGSLAVLLHRPDAPRVEVVNDLDGFVCNFWRAVVADPEGVAAAADHPVCETDLHAWHRWLVARRGTLTAALDADPTHYDATIAGRWAWGGASDADPMYRFLPSTNAARG